MFWTFFHLVKVIYKHNSVYFYNLFDICPHTLVVNGKQELLSILVDGHRGRIGPGRQQMHMYIYIYNFGNIPMGDDTYMLSTDPYDADLGIMVASSNGSIFRVTGPLWGESTGHRWIPLTKASDAELWCFLWIAPEQTAEQTIETPVIWDAIVRIMTSL